MIGAPRLACQTRKSIFHIQFFKPGRKEADPVNVDGLSRQRNTVAVHTKICKVERLHLYIQKSFEKSLQHGSNFILDIGTGAKYLLIFKCRVSNDINNIFRI